MLLGVRRHYLETALAEMRTTVGDVETYFVDGLGVDAQAQERLREGLSV